MVSWETMKYGKMKIEGIAESAAGYNRIYKTNAEIRCSEKRIGNGNVGL
jgi:hypothetical protein